MSAIVHEQRGFLLERLPANVANVRSFAGMDAFVILRASFRRKHSAANVARKVLYAGVRVTQVSRQSLIYAKLFATKMTSVRSFSGVYTHVPEERVRRIEILPTLVAMIIDLPVDLHFSAHHHFSVGTFQLSILLSGKLRVRFQ